MRGFSTRFGIAALWLIHWLPRRIQGGIAIIIGELLFWLAAPRRKVALINLRLCFPELSEQGRTKIVRQHFYAFARAIVEHGRLWWQSEAKLRAWIHVVDEHHFTSQRDKPIILLAPHFIGLDMGGARFSMDWHGASMYSRQKNPLLDRIIRRGRERFNAPLLLSRQEGLRGIVKALKAKVPFYYLPDMDLGPRDAIFTPFFGYPAATVVALPRLAALTKAVVVPIVTRQTKDGYEMRYYPAWENYPSGDIEADVRRMNAFIEDRAREMLPQYLWTHKRFKTRPPGEPNVY